MAGPTASGKSETALALAERLDTEIVSADSMQVYKYFDIGTAKPSRAIRQKVVHHLVDILEPNEEFNAFEFKTLALKHVDDMIRRNKIPILSGGTGLYLKTFAQDLECAAVADPEIKQRVRADIKEKGTRTMHAELAKVDPRSAARIPPTDPLRIERALSVYLQTGKPLSEFHANEAPAAARGFDPYFFLLDWDRDRLYENIERRIDSMLQNGWVDEVKGLLNKKFSRHLKPFQSIGYTQILNYLDGQISLDRAVDEIKRETRRYAKRQLTWFRKVPNLISIPVKPGYDPAALGDAILSFVPLE